MTSVNNRLFPEDSNNKRPRIQKGSDQKPVENNNPEVTKQQTQRLGSTKTNQISASKLFLDNVVPNQRPDIAEPTEMSINDSVVPGTKPEGDSNDCVLPGKDPGNGNTFVVNTDNLADIETIVSGNTTNADINPSIVEDPVVVIQPPKVEPDPRIINNKVGEMVDANVIDPNVAEMHISEEKASNVNTDEKIVPAGPSALSEVVTTINEMKEELENAGYSVAMILDSSVTMTVYNLIKEEGTTKGQLKQLIREQLEKAPYHEVANIMDIVSKFLENAGIDNLEDFNLSTNALINEVIFRTGDNNKVYTMSDVKQILDEILCERSEKYKYRDDAKWDNLNIDISDFINYMTKDMSLSKSALNYIYKNFVQNIIDGALGNYNIALITEITDNLLQNGIGSTDLITSAIQALLQKDKNEDSFTLADAKAILNEIIANMPELYNAIEDPTEMHINEDIVPNPNPDPDPDPNPNTHVVNKDEYSSSSAKGLEKRQK